jgi:hypothetical protein
VVHQLRVRREDAVASLPGPRPAEPFVEPATTIVAGEDAKPGPSDPRAAHPLEGDVVCLLRDTGPPQLESLS